MNCLINQDALLIGCGSCIAYDPLRLIFILPKVAEKIILFIRLHNFLNIFILLLPQLITIYFIIYLLTSYKCPSTATTFPQYLISVISENGPRMGIYHIRRSLGPVSRKIYRPQWAMSDYFSVASS